MLVAAHEKENTGRLTKCNTANSRCVLGSGKTLALVWGDSHAIAAVSGVAAAAEQAGGSILFFGQQACPVIFGARSSNTKAPEFCSRFNDMVYARLQTLERDLPVIVIHRAGTYIEPGNSLMYFDGRVPDTPEARRAAYERHLVDSLCRIAARNPLYVVQPIPQMPYDVPAVVAKDLIVHGKAPQPAMSLSAYRAANASMNAALQSASQRCCVRLLDPLPYLCAGESCEGVSDGRPLYSDDNHLSEVGARRLAPMFGAIWQ